MSTASNVSLTPTTVPAGIISNLIEPPVKAVTSFPKSFNILTSSAFALITVWHFNVFAFAEDIENPINATKLKTTVNNFQLLRGKDSNKDQSYFLYRLDQSQVSKSVFPIGTLDKERVREKANSLGFLNHNKKDSTGICFIGERNFRKFLKKYFNEQPGEIISDKGTVIGEHEGLMYYTYGQRQGLGIGGGHGTVDAPWYVSDKFIQENRLVAVQGHDHPDLYHSYLTATNINWISGSSPGEHDIITSKIRYRSKDSSCKIKKKSDSILVEFDIPQFAVAPGQYIVFYHNDVCIGGGIIEARSNTPSH